MSLNLSLKTVSYDLVQAVASTVLIWVIGWLKGRVVSEINTGTTSGPPILLTASNASAILLTFRATATCFQSTVTQVGLNCKGPLS